MAKLALINRNEKRRKTIEKYAAKRADLVAVVNDASRTDEERFEASGLAAEFEPGSSAQPLQADGSSAWRLSQIRFGSEQVA